MCLAERAGPVMDDAADQIFHCMDQTGRRGLLGRIAISVSASPASALTTAPAEPPAARWPSALIPAAALLSVLIVRTASAIATGSRWSTASSSTACG
jgi:hypothetical protein